MILPLLIVLYFVLYTLFAKTVSPGYKDFEEIILGISYTPDYEVNPSIPQDHIDRHYMSLFFCFVTQILALSRLPSTRETRNLASTTYSTISSRSYSNWDHLARRNGRQQESEGTTCAPGFFEQTGQQDRC